MKVRIKNNEPNSAQRKVLRQECIREFESLLSSYNRQVALQILYILHFEYGFGQQRLEKFSESLAEMQKQTITRYETTDEKVPNICEIKLRESGIDIDSLLGE